MKPLILQNGQLAEASVSLDPVAEWSQIPTNGLTPANSGGSSTAGIVKLDLTCWTVGGFASGSIWAAWSQNTAAASVDFTKAPAIRLTLSVGNVETSATIRALLGRTGTSSSAALGEKGYGFEVRTGRLWLVTHDGTALTQSDTGVSLTANTTYVFVFGISEGTLYLRANGVAFSCSGAPTTGTTNYAFLQLSHLSAQATSCTSTWSDLHYSNGVSSALAAGATVGEPPLGNPTSDGMLLSSTAAGVRSWVTPPSGGGGSSSFDGAYASLTGIPSTFTPAAHNQAWSTITSTPTTLSGYGITDAQGLDSDLTALAGLSSNGLIARTADGAAATRTITGTTNQVTVTNGDGVAGNPTLALPQSIATTSCPQFAGLGLGVTAPGSGASVGMATETQAEALNLAVTGSSSIGDGAAISFLHSGTERTYRIYGSAVGENIGSLVFARGTASGYTDAVIFSYDGKLRFAAYGAGTLVTDSSGNITASSDSRLKTVTGSFTRGLDDVLKLTPRTYRWNEKSGMNTEDENVGFIAQEVLGAVPEAVGSMRTVDTEEDDGAGKKVRKSKREAAEYLTLSDRPIIAALVNAVKELKAENDTLRARVSALENGKAAK